MRWDKKKVKYLLYVIPVTLIWVLFSLWPNILMFITGFFKWNGISPQKTFVGLQNFRDAFLDPHLKMVILNTFIYIFALLVLQTVIALGLTLVLHKNTRTNNFFRTLFFSPLVLSGAVVGLTWGYMYDTNLGMINSLLGAMGLQNFQQNWLGLAGVSVLCVVLVHIWQNLGYPLTMMLAGINNIPQNLYEVAQVEGAGPFQTFRHVTLPLLMPTLLRIMLLTITTGALAFDYIFVLTSQGGSYSGSSPIDTLSVYIYRNLTATSNIGKPAALGVLLSVVLFFVYFVQDFVTRRVEDRIQ